MDFIDLPLAQYGKLIPAINALSSFPLFNADRSSLCTCKLPFFEQYQLLEARSFSCIPPVTMHYLWSPQSGDVIKMDGTREAVFNHLTKLRLILNHDTVVSYLAFVLYNVQSEQGALRLVERYSDIEFSDTPTSAQKQFLKENVVPATITDEGETYFVCCMVIYGDTLYEAEIRLEKNGLFDFVSERQVGDKMPCLRPVFLE